MRLKKLRKILSAYKAANEDSNADKLLLKLFKRHKVVNQIFAYADLLSGDENRNLTVEEELIFASIFENKEVDYFELPHNVRQLVHTLKKSLWPDNCLYAAKALIKLQMAGRLTPQCWAYVKKARDSLILKSADLFASMPENIFNEDTFKYINILNPEYVNVTLIKMAESNILCQQTVGIFNLDHSLINPVMSILVLMKHNSLFNSENVTLLFQLLLDANLNETNKLLDTLTALTTRKIPFNFSDVLNPNLIRMAHFLIRNEIFNRQVFNAVKKVKCENYCSVMTNLRTLCAKGGYLRGHVLNVLHGKPVALTSDSAMQTLSLAANMSNKGKEKATAESAQEEKFYYHPGMDSHNPQTITPRKI